jgi:hypothetical protein
LAKAGVAESDKATAHKGQRQRDNQEEGELTPDWIRPESPDACVISPQETPKPPLNSIRRPQLPPESKTEKKRTKLREGHMDKCAQAEKAVDGNTASTFRQLDDGHQHKPTPLFKAKS